MVAITVDSEEEALTLVAQLESRLEDWSDFWGRFVVESLRPMQEIRFKTSAFGSVSKYTQGARDRREGYYGWPPTVGADSARYFWTGNLAEATSFFSWTRPLSASVDPHKNYRGPLQLEYRDPFGSVMGHIKDASIWNLRALDRALDTTIESWLIKDVLP